MLPRHFRPIPHTVLPSPCAAPAAHSLFLNKEAVPVNVIEAVRNRRSIRSFTGEPVPEKTMDRLLDLAVSAATGSGLEPWGFVILNDRDEIRACSDAVKQRILNCPGEYPEFAQYLDWLRKDSYNIFYNAGTVLVIYGDQSSPWHVFDCTLAAANVMLCAQSENIGSCWIGFAQALFDTPQFRKEHHVPDGFRLVSTLALGYAKGSLPPCTRKAPRIFSR